MQLFKSKIYRKKGLKINQLTLVNRGVNLLIQSQIHSLKDEKINDFLDYFNEHFQLRQFDINLFNFQQEYVDFSKWLNDLLKSDPLPEQVVAINFGLFQSENGIQMYLSGSFEWDQYDSDWACNLDYDPKGRYVTLNIFKLIDQIMEQQYWGGIYLTLGIVILFVKIYIIENKKILLPNEDMSIHIATGFDDGDLYNIV